jgi:hypothetical protein
VTRKWSKNLPNFFEKVAKNTKRTTPKLNTKAENIHIKLPLKPSNKPWVESACLGENRLNKK